MAGHDRSNGWEAIAGQFIEGRHSSIGRDLIAQWAEALSPGDAVLDVGCGFGGGYTQDLLDRGLLLHGIDASPTLLDEYRRRYPQARAVCEPAESSTLFDRRFDGILAIGLVFLLSREAQLVLLHNLASVLRPGGRLLFTVPWQVCEWDDLLTGQPSRSLGKAVYVEALATSGAKLMDEFSDEGRNHHFSFRKSGSRQKV